MARNSPLHNADDIIGPSVERTIAAINAPEFDAGLIALARVLAHAIDRMSPNERATMLGQTAPQLFRVLNELERRAQARRDPAAGQAENPVDQMRRANAARRAKPQGAA
jgi:hypothetical protein